MIMLLQRTFKKNYAEYLIDAVRNGQNIDKYTHDYFVYDQEQVVMIPGIAYPGGLLEKMVPNTQGDFQSAVALFEAYPDLTPLQASDRTFWIYLSHVDLFEYIQKRFPKVMENGFENKQYILDHWFFAQGTIMHALSGLWWLTYLSVDDSSDNKYKYTVQIFRDYDLRTNFANYSFARHKEAVIGYLQFMIDNPKVFVTFFKYKNRFITKHFNKIGGTRLLSTLSRDYFYNELSAIKDQIHAVTPLSVKSSDIVEDLFFE